MAQSSHTVLSVDPWNDPAAQAVHADASIFLDAKVPVPQLLQALWPVSGWALPSSHCTHTDRSVLG